MIKKIKCPERSCSEEWSYESLEPKSFQAAHDKCWNHAREAHDIGADPKPSQEE